MRTRTPLLIIAVLALVATAPAAAQDEAFEHEIQMHEFEGGGMHLAPDHINANVGDTLRFTIVNPEENKVSHDLVVCGEPPHPESTCDNKIAFTAGIPPGESRTLTFTVTEAGTFEYFCSVLGHKSATPGMVGRLVVASSSVEPKESPGLAWLGAAGAIVIAALVMRRGGFP